MDAGAAADGMQSALTVTLTPTLCAMLLDPLLQDARAASESLVELSERESNRTYWDKPFNPWRGCTITVSCRSGKPTTLMAAIWSRFRKFQEAGQLEIITSAATTRCFCALESKLPYGRAGILVAATYRN